MAIKRLLHRLFFLSARVTRSHFLRQTRKTALVQQRFLKQLLSEHYDTAMGRDLGLSAVQGVDDFRRLIPVRPYADYEPYLDRVCRGESKVLTASPVIYLTASSGTTGKRKLIPVTGRSSAIRNRARRASTGFFGSSMQHSGRAPGGVLLTNAAEVMGHTEAGVPYGTASAGDLLLNEKAYRGRNLFAFPFAAFRISDSLARHYVCLLFALADRDTAIITGNFPPHVLNLARLIETHADSFISDIEKGTISADIDLSAAQRADLEPYCKANPQRAKELRTLVEKNGRLTPVAAWPNLAAIVTARGLPSHFYFEKFAEVFGDTPVFGGIYGSTEAIYGVYHAFDSDEAVLAINTGFFEFVSEAEWDKPFPETLLAHQVEPGCEYRVLVTNHAGLYRYDIGDVVRVLSFYQGAPTISFQRRKGSPISSFSEKTTESHVEEVMRRLRAETGIVIEDFCVSLSDELPARYLLNIELSPGTVLDNPNHCIDTFDRVLREIHERYRVRRSDSIPAPELRVLAPGSFARLKARAADAPGSDTNVKIRHTADDRHYLDGLEVVAKYPCSL